MMRWFERDAYLITSALRGTLVLAASVPPEYLAVPVPLGVVKVRALSSVVMRNPIATVTRELLVSILFPVHLLTGRRPPGG